MFFALPASLNEKSVMTPANPTARGTAPRLSLPLWTERYAAPPAPMTGAEMRARGWDAVDVVLVSGDAYIDHPSFAATLPTRAVAYVLGAGETPPAPHGQTKP